MTRVLPRFPTAVRGINALSATTANGVLEVGIDVSNLDRSANPAAPGHSTLILNENTDELEIASTDEYLGPFVDAAAESAQIAQDAASDAVSQSNVPIYSSRAAAALLVIPPGINFFRVNGFSASGDTGSGGYRFAASEPAHTGKFQSADGRWWELAEYRPTLAMFGGVAGGIIDCSTAFANLVAFCRAKGVTGQVSGIVRLDSCNFDLTGVSLVGDGEAISYPDTATGSFTILLVKDQANPAFLIGSGAKLDRMTIRHPDQLGQLAPIAFPPVFRFTGSTAAGWSLTNLHVPMAYTLFSSQKATVIGAGQIDNIRAFAMNRYFEFMGGAPEVILCTNCLFSPGAWLGDYGSDRSALLRYGYDNAVFVLENIPGDASYRSIDGFTISNSIVYGVRRVIDRVSGNLGPVLFNGVHVDGIGQMMRVRGSDFVSGLTLQSCTTYVGGPSDNSRMLNTITDPEIDIEIDGSLDSNFSLSGYGYHGLGTGLRLAGAGLRDVFIDSFERRNVGRSQTPSGTYAVLDVSAPNAIVSIGRLSSTNPNKVAGTTLIGVKVTAVKFLAIGSLDLEKFDTGISATEATPGMLIKRIDIGKASMVAVTTPISTNLTSQQLRVTDLITDATGVTRRGRTNFSATNSASFSVTTTLAEMLTNTIRHDFGNDASGGRCIVGRGGPVSVRAQAAFSATAGVIVEMRVQVYATGGGGLRHSIVTQSAALANNLGYLSIATDLNCVSGDEISLWFKTVSGAATVPADGNLTRFCVTA